MPVRPLTVLVGSGGGGSSGADSGSGGGGGGGSGSACAVSIGACGREAAHALAHNIHTTAQRAPVPFRNPNTAAILPDANPRVKRTEIFPDGEHDPKRS